MFLNGLARGCVPADHELFFSRARSKALKGADVALVIGVPMDFRLGFGAAFGEDTEIVVDRRRRTRAKPSAAGGRRVLRRDRRRRCRRAASGAGGGGPAERGAGSRELRAAETGARAMPSRPSCDDDRAPLHPMRLYAELARCSTATRS